MTEQEERFNPFDPKHWPEQARRQIEAYPDGADVSYEDGVLIIMHGIPVEVMEAMGEEERIRLGLQESYTGIVAWLAEQRRLGTIPPEEDADESV